jgi:hypothetical protein
VAGTSSSRCTSSRSCSLASTCGAGPKNSNILISKHPTNAPDKEVNKQAPHTNKQAREQRIRKEMCKAMDGWLVGWCFSWSAGFVGRSYKHLTFSIASLFSFCSKNKASISH